MSQPARPTRVNRKAVFVFGVAIRMSEAMAMIAPAPTHMPSRAAMIGLSEKLGSTRLLALLSRWNAKPLVA